MRSIVPVFFLLLVFAPAAPAQQAITLDDCFSFFRFYPQPAPDFRFTPDGHHYIQEEDGALVEFDLGTGLRSRTLVPDEVLKAVGNWDDYTFSRDLSKVLLRTNTQPVYRHSVTADYWVYDLKTAKSERLYRGGPVQFAVFSDPGNRVAFVTGNNLYVKDITTGTTTQVTQDGAPNAIINGIPDWVYEEEFSPPDGDGMVATAWSPDGNKLAFIRFDEREVPEFQLSWYAAAPYPKYTRFKFPKVGSLNSRVSVHVYDLKTGKLTQPLAGSEDRDIYLPRIYWTPDNLLCIYELNREQDNLSLVLYDPEQDATGLLLYENDPAYVDLDISDNLTFLPDGNGFLWLSESDGHTHLYRLPMHPAAAVGIQQLTKGDFDVTEFYGADPYTGKFYYQAATPTPMDRQIWEGSLSGLPPRLLTPGPGTHDAVFTPDFAFFIHKHATLNTPPTAELCTRDGSVLRSLLRNEHIIKLRETYGFAPVEFFTVKAADDSTNLNAWMLRPLDFDTSRQYPVLFDIYGGPGSQTVLNQYDGYIGAWRQLLAQKGYIVVSVDNRGTGARGRDFKKCTQLQLGHLETEDQIAAA
ncbi:MAG: S9 family peptidase, partial [Bacteroidetes bacterium]